ncbi:MAG: hypothetical protein L6V85_08880 [Clostridiales bacterium]|nr:MAG: hypothetical protein L6V85_08880 [Clostridiales bacterium]
MKKRDFKTEKPFYVRDFVAVAMVLAVLIASIVMLTAKKGGTVEVYVDGKLTYSYALDKKTAPSRSIATTVKKRR